MVIVNGTLVCGLEHRQVVRLLPDRDNGTVEAWLGQRPEIGIIARDRGGGYGEAARRALPQAVQVADRWHPMENASAAFLEAVRKSMAPTRVAVGSGPIDPELLTHAERIQYEGHVRREATTAAILSLVHQGMHLKQIARRTGRSRKLVRNAVRGLTGEVFRSRQNSLKAFLPSGWRDAGTAERYGVGCVWTTRFRVSVPASDC